LLSVLRDIKEKLFYVALDFEAELWMAATTTHCNSSYKMADGNEIILGNERFCCLELLFKPSLNEFTFNRIDQTIVESVMKCDIDVRNALFAYILLSGGTAMING
jgi:actin-related protein